jgi:hypothetical protein
MNSVTNQIISKIYEKILKSQFRCVVVAHIYNPSYLGDRDQKDHYSRPVGAESYQVPISTNKNWAWWNVSTVTAMWEV